ncbi:MAG: patatin-like phospholipase family protein [Bacteroidales bacterium]|nr:patatin-like phospholipase family protein [Bacteroidales bacterium]
MFLLDVSISYAIEINSPKESDVTENQQLQNTHRKKVGVVLSGGGAKGVAHVGALKVLEEAGIPIDYIAGTSMGSIVGGLYATGYKSMELDSIIRSQDWTFLLSDQIQRKNKKLYERIQSDKYVITIPLSNNKKMPALSGVVKGRNVYNMLMDMTLGYHDSIDFLKLPIPFSCVSYNMVNGKEVVMNKGELATAIRSSMSIPGVFVPVELDSMLLIDGGVINNFPVDVVKKMGAEVIIGIDVSSGKAKNADELGSVMAIIDQLTTFMGQKKYEENRKTPDLYIHPLIEPYTSASFTSEAVDTLILRGENAARAHWNEIVKLKELIGIDDNYNVSYTKKKITESDSVYIDSIFIEGLEHVDPKMLLSSLNVKPHSVIHKDQLGIAIERVLGTGAFSNVTYRVNKDLVINVVEKPLNSLSFGFRFDSEDQAAIYIATKLAPLNTPNFTTEISGKLGTSPWGRVEASLGNPYKRRLGLAYKIHDLDNSIYSAGKRIYNFKFLQNSVDVFFTNFYLRNFRSLLGARYDHYENKALLGSSALPFEMDKNYELISYYLQLYFDSFDQFYCPTSGDYIKLEYELNTDNGIKYKDKAPFSSVSAIYMKALSSSPRLTFIPMLAGRVLIGDNIAPIKFNVAGGSIQGKYLPQQLPFIGTRYIEYYKNTLAIARLDVRYRLATNHFVSAKGNYARQSNDLRDILNEDSLWGVGLEYSYQTMIGPISLLVDWSSSDKKVGVFFNLGRYF